jgi:8-amino-7-oxononanoate synthase
MTGRIMQAPRDRRLAWIEGELAALGPQGLLRRLTTRWGPQAATVILDGRPYLNFGSNDYLALAGDPRLAAAAAEALRQEGLGSGASPLVTGRSAVHERLETRLAEFEATEAALLFPSGFAANTGAIAALVGPGDAVFSDAKNHASLWDGCRLSRADVRTYPHADWRDLDRRLAAAGRYRRKLVVTDGLFSMDGDLAPLAELAEVVERHDAMLLVDEAHASGVLGRNGRGAAELLGVADRMSLRIGTLSKALGTAGGFAAGSRPLIDWLVQRARPYIYSTAAPAALAAAALAALEIVIAEPRRRRELLARADALRQALSAQGWNVGRSASQIIPVIVGPSQRALDLAAGLRQCGLWVPAIRPPSVPQGEACLRISLTWGHTQEMIETLSEEMRVRRV